MFHAKGAKKFFILHHSSFLIFPACPNPTEHAAALGHRCRGTCQGVLLDGHVVLEEGLTHGDHVAGADHDGGGSR
jgi:hypothetical protein